jgi:tetratricopeptide (TPR) repeat protein
MEVETKIRTLDAMTPPAPDATPPAAAEVLFFQGNALFDLKRTDEAIVVWEAAAQRLREFGPLHNNLAVAYWMTGRIDDAWTSLERAEALGFKVNPSFRADLEKAGARP